MENIFCAVMERITGWLPELSLVDEDYGQLQTDEDTYPVTFPCVLIGNTDIDWSNSGGIGGSGGTSQKGEGIITVRLVIDCYDDTHYNSGTADKIKERQEFNKKLYNTLQGFCCVSQVSPLVRVKSRDFSIPGGIKVYETIFKFTVTDKSALPIRS